MNKQRRKELNGLQDDLQRHGLSEVITNLEAIRDNIEAIKDAEEEAVDNLPESLQTDDARYPTEQLQEAYDKLSEFIEGIDMDVLDEVFSLIEDAKGAAE